jgi:hypothetical protein
MTTQTVPQPSPFGSVDYFADKLRQGSETTLADRVLGAVASVVAAEAKTLVDELRNLLAAEKIVAAELDAQIPDEKTAAWAGEPGMVAYQRELDPEQTGAPIPAGVEGHGELERGTEAWS